MATSDRAFERLYRRYVRDVYRYVLAVLRNPAEAEDVTQTTFLNAYRALQAGEEPQKPHNWLITIAHNACRSRIRFSMRRPKEVPLDAVMEQLEMPEAERPNVRELLRVLGGLPFNQRAAITMRELEGRSYAEIAETLGVTVPAAEALIGRARRTLRSQASAIRGLAVVQLPQSLRSLLGRADVAGGGAVGSATVVKAAALIAAGVVAGGVGLAQKGGTHSAKPEAPIAALVTPSATRAVPRAQHHGALRRTSTAAHASRPRRRAVVHGSSAGPPVPPARNARPDTSPAAVPAASAPAAAAPAGPAQPPAQFAAPAAAPAEQQQAQPAQAAPAAPVTSTVAGATSAVAAVAQPAAAVTSTAASATAAGGAAAQPVAAAAQDTVAAVSPPAVPAAPPLPPPPSLPPVPGP